RARRVRERGRRTRVRTAVVDRRRRNDDAARRLVVCMAVPVAARDRHVRRGQADRARPGWLVELAIDGSHRRATAVWLTLLRGTSTSKPGRDQSMKNMLAEFKAFISKGDIVMIAVGLVMALYFKAIIDNIIEGVINPIIAAIFGKANYQDIGFDIGDARI